MTPFADRIKTMDEVDPLKDFRERFVFPGNLIYLDGNSLGMLPKNTRDKMAEVVEKQWGNRLIRSWNEKWMDLSSRLSERIAEIVGATAEEILVGDTTSLNLFKLAFAGLEFQRGRHTLVTDDLNFPSDQYVFQGLTQAHFPDHSIRKVQSIKGISVETDDLARLIDADTSLVSLSHVAYKTAFLYDMFEVNEMAREAGALTLWDLSHSAGAVPVELNRSGADLAVGCTYKYLNGGPGAPAFLYVRKELQEKMNNPVWSWFGHKAPFAFDPDFKPADGIERFVISTPGILSMSAMEPGLDLILEAGMDTLHAKSVLQGDLLMQMIRQELVPLGFTLASPLSVHQRGSHISIQHEKAYAINRAMIEPLDPAKPSIIPDFRPPNLIRLGIAPLYTSFKDLYVAVERIKEIVETGELDRVFEALTVT
jgi:kynureninase